MRPRLFLLLATVGLLALAASALAIDAQGLFEQAKDSVVVVLGLDHKGAIHKFGSGFFIRQGDLVATNYHVVEKAAQLKIKLKDGSIHKVEEVKAFSKEYDLAVLRVSKGGKPLRLIQNDPKVGEEILAIGNPRGLELSLSNGIISGIRQGGKVKVYQITAPISQGSSGGPILNAQGEAVGLATFYVQGGQNLNFAVPAQYVEGLLTGTLKSGGGGAAKLFGIQGGDAETGSKGTLEIEKERDGSISIKKKN
jgi:S1-C subfamily serine protease